MQNVELRGGNVATNIGGLPLHRHRPTAANYIVCYSSMPHRHSNVYCRISNPAEPMHNHDGPRALETSDPPNKMLQVEQRESGQEREKKRLAMGRKVSSRASTSAPL